MNARHKDWMVSDIRIRGLFSDPYTVQLIQQTETEEDCSLVEISIADLSAVIDAMLDAHTMITRRRLALPGSC